MENIENKVKDQAYFESAMMVAKLTDQVDSLIASMVRALNCIDADDNIGAHVVLTDALREWGKERE